MKPLHEMKISELEKGAWMTIPVNQKQLDKLFEIENQLRKIGVKFDTGTGGCGAEAKRGLKKCSLFVRDWCLDYSLQGAKINAIRPITLKEWAIAVVKELNRVEEALCLSPGDEHLRKFLIERAELTEEELNGR